LPTKINQVADAIIGIKSSKQSTVNYRDVSVHTNEDDRFEKYYGTIVKQGFLKED